MKTIQIESSQTDFIEVDDNLTEEEIRQKVREYLPQKAYIQDFFETFIDDKRCIPNKCHIKIIEDAITTLHYLHHQRFGEFVASTYDINLQEIADLLSGALMEINALNDEECKIIYDYRNYAKRFSPEQYKDFKGKE